MCEGMREIMILGIDSSGRAASAALLADDVIIAECTLNNRLTHSQTLLPIIDEVIRLADADLKDITAIAIAAGPGSFTGLRIGAATAKGMGLVLDIPIIPVPTLEGMAFQMYGTDRLLCPVMDARRNQVYTGLYRFHAASEGHIMGAEDFQVVEKQAAMDIHDLLMRINAIGSEVIFTGDGVPVFEEVIKKEIKVGYILAPAFAARQRAAAVAVLGAYYFDKGIYESAAEHVPEYLRVSQAERERAKRLEREGEV